MTIHLKCFNRWIFNDSLCLQYFNWWFFFSSELFIGCVSAARSYTTVVVQWQQDKNGKEAWGETSTTTTNEGMSTTAEQPLCQQPTSLPANLFARPAVCYSASKFRARYVGRSMYFAKADTEKSFLKLANSNQIWIVTTRFRNSDWFLQ